MFPGIFRTIWVYAYCPDVIIDGVSFHSQTILVWMLKYMVTLLLGRPYVICFPPSHTLPAYPCDLMLLLSPFHSLLWPPCWSFNPPGTFLPPGLCTRPFLWRECFYRRQWHGLLLLCFKFLFNCHLVLRHSLATHSKINIFFPFFLFLFPILLFSLAVISYAIYLRISLACWSCSSARM